MFILQNYISNGGGGVETALPNVPFEILHFPRGRTKIRLYRHECIA
jgi:hypothetical protein